MYILFINSGGKCNIFFSVQFNNNSNKKKLSNPWIQSDPTQPMCWVEIFLTHHGGLGRKIPSTRPIHTPTQ